MSNTKLTPLPNPHFRSLNHPNQNPQPAQHPAPAFYRQRQEPRICLPPSITDSIGFIQLAEGQPQAAQPICLSVQICNTLILAPSTFKLNLPSNATLQFAPKRYPVQQRASIIQMTHWQYFDDLNQNQIESTLLAIGKLQIQKKPLTYANSIQSLKNLDLGQTILIFAPATQHHNNQSESNSKQQHRSASHFSATISQIYNNIIQYRLTNTYSLELLTGAPLFIQTANGFKLIGLHVGNSLTQQNHYRGIGFSQQSKTTIQMLINQSPRQEPTQPKQLPTSTHLPSQPTYNQHHPQLGSYLVRQLNDKKVQLFSTPQYLKIVLQDNSRLTTIYSKVTPKDFTNSQLIIDSLEKAYKMLEFQLQHQHETLDHIFRLHSGTHLQIKLQNHPILTITAPAKLSSKRLSHFHTQQQAVQHIKHQINTFLREKLNQINESARQAQERIKLKLVSAQLQFEKIMEQTKNRIEAAVSHRTDSLVTEVINNLQKEVRNHLDYYLLQREQQRDLMERLEQVTQSLRQQKQQIKQLALSSLEVRKSVQTQLKKIQIKLDSQTFANQMNFVRLEEINAMLRSKLHQIQQQFATITKQQHSTLDHAIVHQNCESINENEADKRDLNFQTTAEASAIICDVND